MREKRSERRPFDKEVERRCPAAWDSVACVSVLLLFAVESLHAEKVASRKGPVLSIAWSSGGMILAAASSNQTVKSLDGDVGKPRVSLEGYTGDVYSIAWRIIYETEGPTGARDQERLRQTWLGCRECRRGLPPANSPPFL